MESVLFIIIIAFVALLSIFHYVGCKNELNSLKTGDEIDYYNHDFYKYTTTTVVEGINHGRSVKFYEEYNYKKDKYDLHEIKLWEIFLGYVRIPPKD